MTKRSPTSLEFFRKLRWIDGRSLLETIEPYRRELFTHALDIYRDDGVTPQHNMIVVGRAKKNWKSADLVLAGFYKLLVPESYQGNDCLILANDEDQAGDDLALAKKLIAANPKLQTSVDVLQKEIRRRDGLGSMRILPSRDAIGAHGKTALFVGFDEIHGYRNWDILEALAPDPTRPDTLCWITSYDTIYQTAGVPLYDLKQVALRGDDPRLLFSWYSADLCTDPSFVDLPAEQRANPSMASWPEGIVYLEQQRRRLPSHKYRRLHLNLPGAPNGAFFDQDAIMRAVVQGRRFLPPMPNRSYFGFVDMSGGSNDDATLAIGHRDNGKAVLDVLIKQDGAPPFNPRNAVKKFCATLRQYRIGSVTGDAYAGQTFRADFADEKIDYLVCRGRGDSKLRETEGSDSALAKKTDFYEALEPALNTDRVELLDLPILQQQILNLVIRGNSIDHQPNAHDDFANAVAGLIWLLLGPDPVAEWGEFFKGIAQRAAETEPIAPALPWHEKTIKTPSDAYVDGGRELIDLYQREFNRALHTVDQGKQCAWCGSPIGDFETYQTDFVNKWHNNCPAKIGKREAA